MRTSFRMVIAALMASVLSGELSRHCEAQESPKLNERYLKYAEALLKQYDGNNDAVLQRDEWNRMKSDYHQSDYNGDGLITKEEFAIYLASLSNSSKTTDVETKPKVDSKPEKLEPPKAKPEPRRELKPAAPKATSSKAPASNIDLPSGRVIFQQSETEKRIRVTLDSAAGEMEFLDSQLIDVADLLRERHGIPIRLDMPALKADGKSPELKITCDIHEGTLRAALRSILTPEELTFAVADDHLVITTFGGAEMLVNTRIYQVHDLVVAANDPTAESPQFQKLYDLIAATILAETWRDNGGTHGSIEIYEAPGVMALVITHTEWGHELVERLLTDLRAASEPKVAEMQRRRQTPPMSDGPEVSPFVQDVLPPESTPTPAAVQGAGRF